MTVVFVAAGMSTGLGTKAYLGFLPWLIFAVVDRSTGLGAAWAGAMAVICAGLGLIAWAHARQLELLDVGAVVLFGSIATSSFVLRAGPGTTFEEYSRSFSMAGLTILLFVSLCSVPVVEQYTRNAIPWRLRQDLAFRQINRALTLEMGGAALCITVCFVIGGTLRGPVGATVFNWIAPIVLIGFSMARISERWLLYLDERVDGALPSDLSMKPPLVLGEASLVIPDGRRRSAPLRLLGPVDQTAPSSDGSFSSQPRL